MEILLPDGYAATANKGEVSVAEKALGVWSAEDGDNNVHLSQNIAGHMNKWISKMKNGHLLARLGWIAYKFYLWPGIKYGLATLTMPLEIAQKVLQRKNFHLLSFLGVNRNMTREWWTLYCTFGGIGLYSLPVEQLLP
jgi:hypothetical protein